MHNTAKSVRNLVLELVYRSHSSHIGSCFSIVDILTVLYWQILTDEDNFLLSKGHAAAALYSVLAKKGLINEADLLKNYGSNGSIFMTHASHKVPGVEFSSGSLGMLASVAVGKALAKKINNNSGTIYVLLSDGELNEGSNWEAFMYAAHLKLDNIAFIIDNNRLQSLTTTKETLNLSNFPEQVESFGVAVSCVNGHSMADLENAFKKAADRPKCIIANTIKGKGSELIENKVLWHYKSPSSDEYELIKQQLNA